MANTYNPFGIWDIYLHLFPININSLRECGDLMLKKDVGNRQGFKPALGFKTIKR